MANEKRLIDANTAILNTYNEVWWTESEAAAVRSFLVQQPTVDAVEVVRCNNCKFADSYERTDGLTGYYCTCDKNSFTYGQNRDRRFNPVKESNDFCSYGERRTNE